MFEAINGINNCPAAGHDIFDEDEFLIEEINSFGVFASAVLFWLFSDEGTREFCNKAEHCGDGDAAHFETGNRFGIWWEKMVEDDCDFVEKIGVGLELVFVEVGITNYS